MVSVKLSSSSLRYFSVFIDQNTEQYTKPWLSLYRPIHNTFTGSEYEEVGESQYVLGSSLGYPLYRPMHNIFTGSEYEEEGESHYVLGSSLGYLFMDQYTIYSQEASMRRRESHVTCWVAAWATPLRTNT
jgi:hypothetical protein